MITLKDLNDIAENKIKNEAQKAIIRSSFPPHIADRMCAAIDGQEKMERFMRLLNEYNERRCRFRSKTGWTTLAATMFVCDSIEMEAI